MLKHRIILIFSALTTVLVAVMAWVSYVAVREIYLNQVSEQTRLLTRLIGSSIDAKYLTFIDANQPSQRAVSYYRDQLAEHAEALLVGNIVLFDQNFQILTQTESAALPVESDARLLLFTNDIRQLNIAEAGASLPFKGHDQQWYLWGFYRLDSEHWLGIRESAARFAEVEKLPKIFGAIGLIGLAFTIFAGVWLASSITKPINQLVNFSRKLGDGDFTAKAPQVNPGELAILASAMDNMRQDLLHKNREKEAMLAQIAHEIRNPLGGMELLSGLVKEDLQQHGADAGYIDKILAEIGGLKSLINAYLNYSRPTLPNPEPLNIAEVLNEVQETLQHKFRQKSVQFEPSVNGAILQFDRQHLRQILFNLLNNSLQSLSDGGTIRVESRQSRIEICDDGPGIDAAHLPKIFDPFFTTRESGTGLGLAICQKLCRENGALLTVENLENGGCKFSIIQEFNQ